jgi:hypothetical protein
MDGVYLARDSKLERDIAIKVLPAQLTSDAIASGGDSTARSNSNTLRGRNSLERETGVEPATSTLAKWVGGLATTGADRGELAVGSLEKGAGHHLDRDIAPESRIPRPVHLAHLARSQTREDLVGS